jgi:hypothetical protein
MVSGESSARYQLGPSYRELIGDYANDGYRQTAAVAGESVRVSVEVRAAPWPIRTPFRYSGLPDWIEPGLREVLEGKLKRCQRQGEALEAVLLVLRNHLAYSERPDFEETPASVLKERRASCVGLTLAAVDILKHLGIESREILGLRADPALGSRRTEGGILHAWLEVRFGEESWAFCDPWMSLGWVPENYLVLRIGGGLDVGPLKSTLGELVTTLSREDRIFFEPAPETSCILWKRPPRRSFMGTLVTGKVLGEGDAPLTGRATMISGEHSTTMDLWRGNFFFGDLDPGRYKLRIEVKGGKPQVKDLEVRPMDKKRVVLYSQ